MQRLLAISSVLLYFECAKTNLTLWEKVSKLMRLCTQNIKESLSINLSTFITHFYYLYMRAVLSYITEIIPPLFTRMPHSMCFLFPSLPPDSSLTQHSSMSHYCNSYLAQLYFFAVLIQRPTNKLHADDAKHALRDSETGRWNTDNTQSTT